MSTFENMMSEIEAKQNAEVDVATNLMMEGKRHEDITEGMSTMARHRFMYIYADQNPKKGKLNGDCNITQCQSPNAIMWNKGTKAWYCEKCARDINRSSYGSEFHPLCITEEEREAEISSERTKEIINEQVGLAKQAFSDTYRPTPSRTPYKSRKRVDGKKVVGRNTPCPCGSGKKYKKCHGSH